MLSATYFGEKKWMNQWMDRRMDKQIGVKMQTW